MLVINERQIREMDKIPLGIFFKRVEEFIKNNVESEIYSNINLKNFIREEYISSTKNGCKSEQEIVNFIINSIQNRH